ncbi:MAG: diadenylate cyclase CdaA [Oscillospiraceae bacterium]|nr:diadenylate cyclase CdaA [Oscillospiraceae bacterium]
MSEFFRVFAEKFFEFINVLLSITPVDVIDILLMAFIIYKGIQLIRETRAEQLIKGILVLLLIFILVRAFELKYMSWILTNVFGQIVVAAVVIFQPEIRRLLERVGTSDLTGKGRLGMAEEGAEAVRACIAAVGKACQTLGESETGALIVFERKTALSEITETGTVVDASATPSLICNIFYPNTPLHDGAMLIRAGRVYAAGCILPLTEKEISRELGTRHRAAIGMSEISDSVVVVVSEETGTISVANNGVLTRGFNGETLAAELEAVMFGAQNAQTEARPWWKRIIGRGSGKD